MQDLQELKQNYDKNILKTIALSKENYDKLKELGFTGESFNTVVGRLLEKVENSTCLFILIICSFFQFIR
jgi:predicted CopG family antitoxin